MFRMASIPEVDKEKAGDLFQYLSEITSRSIYEALCDWCSNDEDIESIYEIYFSGWDEDFDEDDLDDDDFDDSWDDDDDFDDLWGEDQESEGLWDDEYIDDDMDDDDWLEIFEESEFFEGIGQYFTQDGKPLTDEAAGKEILSRKIARMKEKMVDPDEFYTFDVFEEFLFSRLIRSAEVEEEILIDEMIEKAKETAADNIIRFDDYAAWNKATVAEQETSDKLVKEFGINREIADSVSRQIHRVSEMNIYKAEDTPAASLMFWDDDYDVLFENGFVEGLLQCAGSVGESMGYGYEYTCEIFSDMGMKPPVRLLGTKEANAIRNQMEAEKIRENLSKLLFPHKKDLE